MINTNKGSELGPKMDQAPAAMTPSTQEETTGTSPWRHESRTWKDGEAGGTPITAAALNQIDTELASLFASTPVYTVIDKDDPVPSKPCTVQVVDRDGNYQGSWYDSGVDRVQVGWRCTSLSYVVDPFGFSKDMGTVSVRSFWSPLPVDVPVSNDGSLVGTLPDTFRPFETETGLLLSSGFTLIGAVLVSNDGQVRIRARGTAIEAGTRVTLASFAYHAKA